MATAALPRPRVRRRWKLLAALALGLLAMAAVFPFALGTPPARRWLLARANAALSPGRFHFDSIRLSWIAPTTLKGVALFDPQGDRVAAAPRATWDRSLFQILFDRDNRGTLTLVGAALDVERREDGSIDLVDALKPILRPNPRLDFHLRIADGSLKFRGPGLARPLTADSASFDLDIPSGFRPLDWRLRLAKETGNRPGATLEITGRADRPRPDQAGLPDLSLSVDGSRWPLALNVANGDFQGRYHGKVQAGRVGGRWTIAGQAQVLDFDASAPILAGDRVQLDRVGGSWKLVQGEEGWAVETLDLRSPLGSLRATGRLPARPGEPAQINGSIDLAALASQLPHAIPLREGLTLRRGLAELVVEAQAEAGRTHWDASARITDLVARDGDIPLTLRDPATLSARWIDEADRLALDHFRVKAAFLDAEARGDLHSGITLGGRLDLGALRRQASEFLDLGSLELDGQGRISASYRRAEPGLKYAARLELAMEGVRVAGLRVGTLRRENLQVNATLTGPISASGLPTGWVDLQVAGSSGATTATLSAAPGAGSTDLSLSAQIASPIRLNDREGQAGGSLRGRWNGHDLTLDPLRIELSPAEGAGGPLALTARGHFDADKGDLILSAPEGPPTGSIALGPGGLQVAGLGGSGTAIDARIALIGDFPTTSRALSAWAVAVPSDVSGTWGLVATARTGADGLRFGGKWQARDLLVGPIHDPSARTLPDFTLSIQGSRPAGADRIDLREIVLATRYATLEASGTVDDPLGERMADLKGTLTPDWEAINSALADRVEPKARVTGKARAVHFNGALGGDATPDAELGIELESAECCGMRLGPASIVARAAEGGVTIDPIRSTLNGGTLALEPELGRDEQGRVLRLLPGSTLKGAEINDEVSRRVLAYVAPILDAATRARGQVSVDVERAEFPIGGEASRRSVVEGHVVFRDAEFAPGPLAVGLLRLVGKDETSTLKLDQPVVLSVADGRVHQRGLAVPLGKLTRIELDGAVGFDRTLDLKASLPLTPAMVGNNPLLGDIVGGARIAVPIGGTLDAPKIDRDAFNLALKGLGKDLLQRGAVRGASELPMRLTRPREVDPAAPAPPRLTPEERRAQRQQRKADRQDRRAERRGGLVP